MPPWAVVRAHEEHFLVPPKNDHRSKRCALPQPMHQDDESVEYFVRYTGQLMTPKETSCE